MCTEHTYMPALSNWCQWKPGRCQTFHVEDPGIIIQNDLGKVLPCKCTKVRVILFTTLYRITWTQNPGSMQYTGDPSKMAFCRKEVTCSIWTQKICRAPSTYLVYLIHSWASSHIRRRWTEQHLVSLPGRWSGQFCQLSGWDGIERLRSQRGHL